MIVAAWALLALACWRFLIPWRPRNPRTKVALRIMEGTAGVGVLLLAAVSSEGWTQLVFLTIASVEVFVVLEEILTRG